ncbi:MAG: Ig-like domain-containing protein [Planctomycetota bacterium]
MKNRLVSPGNPGASLRLPAALSLSLLVAAGCQKGPAEDTTSAPTQAATAGTGLGGGGALDQAQPQFRGLFIDEDNAGGLAPDFQLVSVSYGRLVELWGKDHHGQSVRVARDFVIGPDFAGDGVTVWLETQPVLGVDRLMIDADVEDDLGRETFLRLAMAAADAAEPLSDHGATGDVTSVPRNAALVLRFNDLVDPASKDALAALLRVGDPAVVPFDFRFADHDLIGGIDDATGAFFSTRLIVDVTITEQDMLGSSAPFSLNAVGLPEATTEAGRPDAELRLPTLDLAGVGAPLRSAGGTPLGISPGTVDYSSSTRDLVRSFGIQPTSSPYNGFLGDNTAPRLVAEAQIQIGLAPQLQAGTPDIFELDGLEFANAGCAGPAQVGDILSQPGLVAEVIADSGAPVDGVLSDVMVRLLDFPSSWPNAQTWETQGVGVAFYQAPFNPATDDTRVACLVQPFPTALGGAAAPTRGISPDASFQLRFNEPLSPGSGELESVVIGSSPIESIGDFDPRAAVVAVGETFGGTSISGGYFVRPEVPLAHEIGSAEVYYITPRLGVNAVRDLAGNALEESSGPIAMSVDPSAADERTGGAVFGFSRADELGNAGRDFAGQLQDDFSEEVVRARPVIRFPGNVDNSQPILSQQTQFPFGVVTPFSPFGSRMQTVWRYADMGFGLTDPSTINIDVEKLYWAPSGGSIVADSFSAFEIRLTHSRWAPDEFIDPNTLFPQFRNSGLRAQYANNRLEESPTAVVHPRQLGYVFSPGDIVTAPSGQPLVPFPLNRVANEPLRTYTWRDTAVRGRAGLASAGVEPWAYLTALGLPIPNQPYYPTGEVQTIGLPLLMDFSTFPDPGAVGQNGWVLNLAANSSSRPYFRAFSTGGTNVSGQSVLIDPDAELSANGGFNPGSNPPGQATFGRDNSVMLGAADFVVRKSLVHSVWLDTGSASPARLFAQPVLQLGATSAPGATASVDVRGAFEIEYLDGGSDPAQDNDSDENGVADMLEAAELLDLYGDYYNEDDPMFLSHRSAAENPGITFAGVTANLEGSDWRVDAATIIGARYVQLRLTLESDIVAGGTAAAGAVGVAWTE